MQIGAYDRGSDPALDDALERMPALERFLRQAPDEIGDLPTTIEQLYAAVGVGQ